jgi:hypothetical protein
MAKGFGFIHNCSVVSIFKTIKKGWEDCGMKTCILLIPKTDEDIVTEAINRFNQAHPKFTSSIQAPHPDFPRRMTVSIFEIGSPEHRSWLGHCTFGNT